MELSPREKRTLAMVAVVLSLVFAGISTFYDFENQDVAVVNETALQNLGIQIRNGDIRKFKVEVAKTPVDIEVGLMHRRALGVDQGMIFQLGKQPRVAGFWMKNTPIPLDILFIDDKGSIVKIHENAVPFSLTSISSEVPVIGVLEIAGGTARSKGIQVGDQVIHEYFE